MICHNWQAGSATLKMQLIMISCAELRAVSACKNCPQVTTLFPGSLFSASLSRWNRDPGCGWSLDHLSIQNRRVRGYKSTFGFKETLFPHPSSRFFYQPDSGWSRDQPKPASLFQRLREAEKRDPGKEVGQLTELSYFI